jgi:hypothetical protein
MVSVGHEWNFNVAQVFLPGTNNIQFVNLRINEFCLFLRALELFMFLLLNFYFLFPPAPAAPRPPPSSLPATL